MKSVFKSSIFKTMRNQVVRLLLFFSGSEKLESHLFKSLSFFFLFVFVVSGLQGQNISHLKVDAEISWTTYSKDYESSSDDENHYVVAEACIACEGVSVTACDDDGNVVAGPVITGCDGTYSLLTTTGLHSSYKIF